MSEAEAESFESLMNRVRSGDELAATALVRRFEPMVRRAARVRLADDRLGRILDSMDICQSVLASFFVRAALGQYELETPEQLLKLLATMARNKLANQANHQRAARRDVRRVNYGAIDDDLAGRDASPSYQLVGRELLANARSRFSHDELRLIEMRQDGVEWAVIAAELGSSPEAIRKKYTRAVDRVAREIGLDEPDDA